MPYVRGAEVLHLPGGPVNESIRINKGHVGV